MHWTLAEVLALEVDDYDLLVDAINKKLL